MEIYVLFFITVVILLMKKNFHLTLVALALFSGFRYNVGTDYSNYVFAFKKQNLIMFEKGFFYLNKAIYFFTNNSQIVFLISSTIIMFFIWKAIKNYKLDPKIALFIYFTVYYIEQNFNLLRHGIAASILFYAFSNRSKKRIFFFIILASLFQKVSLVFIIFLFFLNKKSSKLLMGILIISLIVYFTKFNILKEINNLNFLTNGYIKYKLKVYLENRNPGSYGITFGIMLRILMLIFIKIKVLSLKKINEQYVTRAFNIIFLGIILALLINNSGIFIQRILNICFMFEIVLLSYAFMKHKRKINFIIIIICCLFYYKIIFKMNSLETIRFTGKKFKYIPYKMKIIN